MRKAQRARQWPPDDAIDRDDAFHLVGQARGNAECRQPAGRVTDDRDRAGSANLSHRVRFQIEQQVLRQRRVVGRGLRRIMAGQIERDAAAQVAEVRQQPRPRSTRGRVTVEEDKGVLSLAMLFPRQSVSGLSKGIHRQPFCSKVFDVVTRKRFL